MVKKPRTNLRIVRENPADSGADQQVESCPMTTEELQKLGKDISKMLEKFAKALADKGSP